MLGERSSKWPRETKEKEAIDNIVDQLDLDGVTQGKLFGEGGAGQGINLKDPQQSPGGRDGQPTQVPETFFSRRPKR